MSDSSSDSNYEQRPEMFEDVLKRIWQDHPDEPFIGLVIIAKNGIDLAYYTNACPVCMALAVYESAKDKEHMNHPEKATTSEQASILAQIKNQLDNKKPSLN